MSALSIDSRFRTKAGILVIEVRKDSYWYDVPRLADAMEKEEFGNVVIIVAGDYSDIDFTVETRPEIKKLFRHTFDFGSWEERDCVDLFERRARQENFLIGEGVRERVADGCFKCKIRHSCDKGHDVNMFWALVKRRRALRVYETPETKRTILVDDIEGVDSLLYQAEMREETGL
jgi:hypothetical protein